MVRATDQSVGTDPEAVRAASPDPVDPHGGGGTGARRIEDVGRAWPRDDIADHSAAFWQAWYWSGDGAAERDLPQPRAADQQPRVNVGVLVDQVDLRQFDGGSAGP